ncbi:MAG: hypothetical protein MI924_04705 [Chloroflexales bacterium]|nr:hypothetical protein [Chloroflexales bacterium]
MVDHGQDMRHPRACLLRGDAGPGERISTAAVAHAADQGDHPVVMGDGVTGQWQRGRAVPPGDDPAQPGRNTVGQRDLRGARARLGTTILAPLRQPLPCRGSVEAHDERDQDGGQAGACVQHRAVTPQRQSQRVSRPQYRQRLRYLLLDLIPFPWKAHHIPWLERFYPPSSCHCDALFATSLQTVHTSVRAAAPAASGPGS